LPFPPKDAYVLAAFVVHMTNGCNTQKHSL